MLNVVDASAIWCLIVIWFIYWGIARCLVGVIVQGCQGINWLLLGRGHCIGFPATFSLLIDGIITPIQSNGRMRVVILWAVILYKRSSGPLYRTCLWVEALEALIGNWIPFGWLLLLLSNITCLRLIALRWNSTLRLTIWITPLVSLIKLLGTPPISTIYSI